MTIKILTDNSQKVIYWSNVHSAFNPKEPILHVNPLQSSLSPIINSIHVNSNGKTQMPIVKPADLTGKVFTMDSGESGESSQACIVEMIEDHQDGLDCTSKIQFMQVHIIYAEIPA